MIDIDNRMKQTTEKFDKLSDEKQKIEVEMYKLQGEFRLLLEIKKSQEEDKIIESKED